MPSTKQKKMGPLNKVEFEALEMPFVQRALEMYLAKVEEIPPDDPNFRMMTKDFILIQTRRALEKINAFFGE